MMKKMEKQIPIVLPNITSKLGDEPDEKLHIIALKNNQFMVANHNKDWQGKNFYTPISDFSQHLKDLPLNGFNAKDFPIRIDADRDVTIQTIINTLDVCSLQGFENIQLHLFNDEFQPVQRNRKRRNWRQEYYR
jgi:biopolymer transport protein ExbD